MALVLELFFILWPLIRVCQASLSDPWSRCPAGKMCKAKFANSICDKECNTPHCLRDGLDCTKDTCKPGYVQYCRDHYQNNFCEHSCNTASCGWDGSDCFQNQQPNWAKGTLVLQTSVTLQKGSFQNGSLLWALSVLLQTSVRLRGAVPFQTSDDLFSLEPRQLLELQQQPSSHKSNGTLLFLQLDNRPCTRLPDTCFQSAAEAAGFLSAMDLNRAHNMAQVWLELAPLVAIRGIDQEIPVKESVAGVPSVTDSPAWLWPVVGVASGMGVALAMVGVVLLIWAKRRRGRRGGGARVRHRSTATDDPDGSKAWMQCSAEPHKGRGRRGVEKERNGAKKKKKKEKEVGKRRSEPLGEDAMRMRKNLDIGSDTDMTQSSMEDITRSICDHRSPNQKHFDLRHQQPTAQALPRRWERSPAPMQQRTTTSAAPVQWCGPDGSVVLIRAVRSGLDRVVLELLRAGVPVNNTDHTEPLIPDNNPEQS